MYRKIIGVTFCAFSVEHSIAFSVMLRVGGGAQQMSGQALIFIEMKVIIHDIFNMLEDLFESIPVC